MITPCPICNGLGKTTIVVKHHQTNKSRITTEWCNCVKSRFISDQEDYRIVSWLQGNYISPDQIDPKMNFNPGNLNNSPNLLIKADEYQTFCLHLKAMLMVARFKDPIPFIYCCRSIDLVHNFYVQQVDGLSPHLSETEKFDLLVFTLDTEEKNQKLPSCVAQVVYSRMSIKKPTWIYYSKSSLSLCQEFSNELQVMLENFTKVNLVALNSNGKSNGDQKKKAENFGGIQ